ncbi:MAG TPA: DUF934 domain-containing protein [Steroidobacteraceae bacterium]|nr:DUF934 domain-containing protein [Steroidobacteraceae bacterium]
MRYILRRREVVADDWRHLGEEAGDGTAGGVDGGLIVPLAQLRDAAQRWQSWSGRLGVRLTPADPVEELAGLLPQLGLVAVDFPNPGDGRGYSQGRLLRVRLGFRGELRAMGAGVRQDQVFLLARCGFDALELAPGEDLEAARGALERYDVAYQPGAAQVALRRQRFGS